MRFRRQQVKARRDAKRRGSAFACRIAGVRSTEQSEAYTVRKRGKLFENAYRIDTREACERDCMRFRRQQAKARRDAKRRGSAFPCGIAGVRSTEQSAAYTVRKRGKLNENAGRTFTREACERDERRFRRQQGKARRDAKRRGSAFACGIAGVRSTKRREAVKGTRGQFL